MEDNELLQITLATIATNLERIAIALEQAPQPAPNIIRDLAEYWGFDWSSIGATVLATDKHGATVVFYRDKMYGRRTHPKYDLDIWYSRGIGKTDDETNYERLITFKDKRPDVEPLPEKTIRRLRELRSQGANTLNS